MYYDEALLTASWSTSDSAAPNWVRLVDPAGNLHFKACLCHPTGSGDLFHLWLIYRAEPPANELWPPSLPFLMAYLIINKKAVIPTRFSCQFCLCLCACLTCLHHRSLSCDKAAVKSLVDSHFHFDALLKCGNKASNTSWHILTATPSPAPGGEASVSKAKQSADILATAVNQLVFIFMGKSSSRGAGARGQQLHLAVGCCMCA